MRSIVFIAALVAAAPALLGGCGGGSSNRVPIAVIAPVGQPQLEITPFVLDASGSTDPEGDTLGFVWEQVGGPAADRVVDVPGEPASVARFIAPKVTGVAALRFRVTVLDSHDNGSTAEIDVAVREGLTVVYVANQDRADAFEVYRVHESDADPVKLHADVAPGAGVARADSLKVSPDRRHVAYIADRDGDGNQDPADLYVARLDGGGEAQFSFDALAVDADIAWSPDGSRLAFTVGDRDAGAQALYTARADGVGGAVLVSGTAITDGGVAGFGDRVMPAWSPDGTHVAFLGDLETDGVRTLFVAAGDGSGTRTAVASPVSNFAWSPDGARLVMQGALETEDIFEIFTATVGAGGAVGAPQKISGARAVAAGGTDNIGWRFSPAGDRIAFTGMMETVNVRELFVTRLDGSGGRTKVIPGTLPAGARVFSSSTSLAWSADGARLVFSGVLDADGRERIYAAPADGSAAPAMLSGSIPTGGQVFRALSLQPGTGVQRVSFFGDLDADDILDVYTAAIDGSGPRVNMSGASGNHDAEGPGAWAPDGSLLLLFGDLETDGVREHFATAPDATGGRVNLTGPAAAGGVLDAARFTPDSGALIFAGDLEVDGTAELFIRPRAGITQRTKLSGPMAAGGGVSAFAVAGPEPID